MKNQRIKSLSTRYLGFYKKSMVVMLATLMLFFFGIAAEGILSGKRIISPLTNSLFFGFLIHGWIKINRNVYQVEFDEEYLYVILRSQDILIPLENIKEIDIKSLGGVYEVELYNPEQLGKKFYFKPSLLYPLNFKKKDALVNVLRKNIQQRSIAKATGSAQCST